MNKLREPAELMEKGFLLLKEQCYAEALKVGHELKALRHSSAFEILALAYLGSGKLSRAIAVLEEGVHKAGRVWILWELLGNCYSDAGRFSDAEKAYGVALERERCERDVVHLNRAIAFNRSGKYDHAKKISRLVKSPRLRRRALAIRIRTALHLGEAQSAQRLALQLSLLRPIAGERCDGESESELFLVCALALKDNLKTKSKALRLAFKAVEVQASNTKALAVIRGIQGQEVAGQRLFRLMIHGVWDAPIGKSHDAPPGFFRTLEIAAISQQAAFGYAKPFFPKAVRESLAVEEIKHLRSRKPTMEGVYFLSGYYFYRRRGKH